MPTWTAIAFLVALLGLAVIQDWRSRRIANPLVACGMAAGLALQAAGAGRAGVVAALAGAALGGAVLLPFHLLRGMGAGDVKLMAAVGCFLGPAGVLGAALCTFLAGGVLGVALLAARRSDAVSRSPAAATDRLPYSVAIASGTLAYLVWRALA